MLFRSILLIQNNCYRILNKSVFSVSKRFKITSTNETLVSAEWLKENLKKEDSNICLLDASWHLTIFERDALKEYEVSIFIINIIIILLFNNYGNYYCMRYVY